MGGTNDWIVMTRVGPSNRTPLKTTTFATAAARIPEYAIARTIGTSCADCSGPSAPGAEVRCLVRDRE